MRISDWSSDVCSSDLFESGPVEDISAEILLRPGGPSPTEPTIYRVPADMLVCNNGCWTLDEATILFDGEAKVPPDALADLMSARLFCYSDHCGHASCDTLWLECEP